MVRVTFRDRRYPVRPDESVLGALVRGGAEVAHSCRKGTCQICLLKCTEGDPGLAAQERLSAERRGRGYFLPCQSHPETDLTVVSPDPSDLFASARVEAIESLAPGVVKLVLEPLVNLTWRPGQFLTIRHPASVLRSYSVANVPREDYFVELHVKRIEGGLVSQWLHDEIRVDDELAFSGPAGHCTYRGEDPDAPLLLIGTGTGIAPLAGIVREALSQGHRGRIDIYHGVRVSSSLYLDAVLREWVERAGGQLIYHPCVSGGPEDGGPSAAVSAGGPEPCLRSEDADVAPPTLPSFRRGRASDLAVRDGAFCRGRFVYLCGNPDAVESARVDAIRAGVRPSDLFADPFTFSQASMPRDKEKLQRLEPEPELWAALESGPGLRTILEDFYDHAYEDSQLSPFFHRVTKQRAIDKQYEFTVDLFTRSKHYFGLGPFNAHHWMVISDELFDHRERLLEECMRRYGLAEHLIGRWLAIDELFRREIVKSAPRGLVVDGQERMLEGYAQEELAVGSLCDGCERELPAGTSCRLEIRTGRLFCSDCAARRVGETLPPSAA